MLALQLVPKDRLSTVFVALVCCQPSFVAGIQRGGEQLLASAVGAGGSLALVALAPGSSWALGASVAVTCAIGGVLRWPYPTLVVGLFSSIYMSLYQQATLQGTALLRCEAVALGVLAAMAVNVAFSPLVRRANLQARVGAMVSRVREQLAGLHVDVVAGAAEAIAARLPRWEAVFQELGAAEDELGGLSADARIAAGSTGALVQPGAEALDALEQILHHALDVGQAVARVLADRPADGEEQVRLAGASLAEALAAISRAEAGDTAGAGAIAGRELMRIREIDRTTVAPLAVEERLGPRLILLVALAELHHHVGRLAHALDRMAR
ncbi:MAG: hypothetical protein JWM80_3968 [Cyanobacteria bacterium RYN_339]|nr:hypothetical protein [Cyanobacteria bacterium RYN_339]